MQYLHVTAAAWDPFVVDQSWTVTHERGIAVEISNIDGGYVRRYYRAFHVRFSPGPLRMHK